MDWRWTSACFCLPLILPGQSLKRLEPQLSPAFLENRIQGPAEFPYAISPWGWLVSCSGPARPRYDSTSGWFVLRQLELEGANPGCLVEASDPGSAHENFYQGRGPNRTAESLPRYGTLTFREVWPDVDARYDFDRQRLRLTFTARKPGALAQVRIRRPDFETWPPLELPPPEAISAMYLLGAAPLTLGLPSLAPDGSTLWTGSEGVWSALDPSALVCPSPFGPSPCPGAVTALFDSESRLRWVTWMRGSSHDTPMHAAFDPGGNIYLAGATYSSDFPATPGKLQSEYAGPVSLMVHPRGQIVVGGDVFLAKLHGPSGLLIHSTLYGGAASEIPLRLAVDGWGRAVLGIRKMDGTWTEQVVGIAEDAAGLLLERPIASASQGIAINRDGRLAMFTGEFGEEKLQVTDTSGEILADGIPLPPGLSYQNLAVSTQGEVWVATAGFNETAEATGILLRWRPGETRLTAIREDLPPGAVVAHADGHLSWVVSTFHARDVRQFQPGDSAALPEPCPDSGMAMLLSPEGAYLRGTWLYPFTSNDVSPPWKQELLLGSGGAAWLLDWSGEPQPALACVWIPPDRYSTGGAAPGSLVAIAGKDLAPSLPSGLTLDLPTGPDGRLISNLGGTRALLGEMEAPILRISRNRMEVVVPQRAGPPPFWLPLRLQTAAGELGSTTLGLSGAALQPLSGFHGFQVTNEDGRPNSQDNPAREGEFVRSIVAGAGRMEPMPPEGALHYDDLPRPAARFCASRELSGSCEPVDARQMEGMPPGIVELKTKVPRYEGTPQGVYPFVFYFRTEGAGWFVPERVWVRAGGQ